MRASCALAAVLVPFLCEPAVAADWRPVVASELALKTPRVDPNADAEAILWDVRIEDSIAGGDLSLSMNHYIRIKIFTELAITKYATVEIPRYGKRFIIDVAGRTIKADGTIVELKKDAIFDKELIKAKNLKLRGIAFTLPNVSVGDVIEYRYKEVRDNEIASHMRLYFQRELPLWSVSYHLKPLQIPWLPFGMRTMAFQCNHPPFEREPNGFYTTTMKDVPAFKEEPDMPPEDQLRSWVLIYYEEEKKIDAEKYWKETGKSDFSRYKSLMNADGAVKRTAIELTSSSEKPEDKLAALERFCRTKVKNLDSSAFRITGDERKNIKENHSPGDTLKQMAGRASDVNLLFASLANSAGFEARIARVPDRGDTFFVKARPTTYFLDNFSVAVKLNDKWTFCDPATPYLERGMLRWQEESGTALISDPKEGFFSSTQASEPDRSTRQRRATFKLLEDGSLAGSVQYTYTGHAARARKLSYEDMTPAQQEEDWKKSLQDRLSTAEMSEFAIENVSDPEKPVVVRHQVSVPGYATRTGKRILLQPAFFQRNLPPRYTEGTRKWDMYFDYAWAEDDEVVIDLPEGWVLDAPTVPENTVLGAVGAYSVEVRKTTDGKKLIYRRKFDWGRGSRLIIPAAGYSAVKKAFDFIQEQDNYTLALRSASDAR